MSKEIYPTLHTMLAVAGIVILSTSVVYAGHKSKKHKDPVYKDAACTKGHWYVGANLGLAHLHDNKNPGSTNSVDVNGPGGSVVGGYQFNNRWGAELGYTQYYNSRETSGNTIVAKTQHMAVHLAATGRYPLTHRWHALGKLGLAYNYAQKMAIGSGFSRSANAGSAYWGLGVDYAVTRRVDFVAQFAEAVGNHLTGSADLWSVGLNVALV